MADKKSAKLFGQMFTMLAENPTKEHKNMARNLFEQEDEYDFCLEQMDVDQALIDLELAVVKLDDDGEEIVVYLGDEDFPLVFGESHLSERVRYIDNDDDAYYYIQSDPGNVYAASTQLAVNDYKLGTLVTIEDLEIILEHMKKEQLQEDEIGTGGYSLINSK